MNSMYSNFSPHRPITFGNRIEMNKNKASQAKTIAATDICTIHFSGNPGESTERLATQLAELLGADSGSILGQMERGLFAMTEELKGMIALPPEIEDAVNNYYLELALQENLHEKLSEAVITLLTQQYNDTQIQQLIKLLSNPETAAFMQYKDVPLEKVREMFSDPETVTLLQGIQSIFQTAEQHPIVRDANERIMAQYLPYAVSLFGLDFGPLN